MRPAPRCYRKLRPRRPFGPRPHVDANPGIAEQIAQREVDVAGLSGAVAVGDNVLVGRDALSQITGPQLRSTLPDVTKAHQGEIVLPVVIDGFRNVAPPDLRTGLSGIL